MRSDARDPRPVIPVAAKVVLLFALIFTAVYILGIQYIMLHHSHYTLGEAIYWLHDVVHYNFKEWLAQWL